MSIHTKLEEIQMINKIRGNSKYTRQCVYHLGEKELVAVKAYMKATDTASEAQAVRELLLLGFANFAAGEE